MKWSIVVIYLIVSFTCIPKIVPVHRADDPERNPQLPITLNSAYTTPTGQTIYVGEGGDLQAAINAANSGDQILLQAGTVFTGNFILPYKEGSEYIYIRSSTADDSLSPLGTRITPSKAGLMAKIITPNSDAAIKTEAKARNYRLIGLEVGVAEDVSVNYGVVLLGSGSGDQDSLDLVPSNIVIDRCFIHGNSAGDVFRGIALNSASTSIIDSHVSNFHAVGFDTQAICGWNGPGPFKIVNNYLEGAGENLLLGGADPAISGLVPSDVEFRRNYCYKPLSWKTDDSSYAGKHWSVKNLFELKNAQRVLIDGNIFENNWADAQNGFAILFTPRNQDGMSPWSVVQDVTFSNNIILHVASGINILGTDDIYKSRQTQRIKVSNNLFQDVGGAAWKGGGRFLQTLVGPAFVTVENNTVFQTGEIIMADGGPAMGFVYRNNISPHNEYGIIGTDAGTGDGAISIFFPDGIFEKNIIVGKQISDYYKSIPDNFFLDSMDKVGFVDLAGGNLLLSSSSSYKGVGAEGRDPGADINKIQKAISEAETFFPLSVSARSAVISWTANAPVGTQIEFGTTMDYGNAIVIDQKMKNVTLIGLPVGSLYYYRVKIRNGDDNQTVLGGYNIATLLEFGEKNPIIKSQPSSDRTIITWTTSDPSTSQVEYGKTIDYGKTSDLKEKLVTKHQVKLKKLAKGVLYHYRVKSRDAAGNLIVSPDLSFETPAN